MSERPLPARVVAPGRILCRELEARGWTQRDLADITGRPPQTINEIVRGTKQITPETAIALGEAFGTSSEFWTNLESRYRTWLAHQGRPDGHDGESAIVRRSRLYSLAPVAELTRRGWIWATKSVDELEKELCRFLGIASPAETPSLAVSFRQTKGREPEVGAEVAWVRRVEQLARRQSVPPFSRERLAEAIPDVLAYSSRLEDVERVPPLILSLGVHFVVVPHLPRTYLDGAAFCLDDGRPVVALTLRYDRIDAFWFTLTHELAHIVCGHEGMYLDSLDDDAGEDTGDNDTDDSRREKEADRVACDWLLEPSDYLALQQEAAPYFSRAQIERFARAQARHPGIVLGRLQHDHLVGYQQLRALLPKVRPYLDGWVDQPGIGDKVAKSSDHAPSRE